MPNVLKIAGYRFFFYSGDRDEPVHIHVEKENMTAKIWIDPIRLQNSGGFSRKEINNILKIIKENQNYIMEAWNEFFGG